MSTLLAGLTLLGGQWLLGAVMRGACEMRVGGEQGFEGCGGDLGLCPKSHEKARQGGTMTPFILEEGERGSGPREGGQWLWGWRGADRVRAH